MERLSRLSAMISTAALGRNIQGFEDRHAHDIEHYPIDRTFHKRAAPPVQVEGSSMDFTWAAKCSIESLVAVNVLMLRVNFP
jgi:hypothetical protein